MNRFKSDAGETLVEVVITMVIMSVVISALFAGFSTAARASKAHRDAVTADAVLRNYAEAVKSAVRTGCSGGATYNASYTPPSGYAVSAAPSVTNAACPVTSLASNASLAATTLTVTWNDGNTSRTLQIGLRTP